MRIIAALIAVVLSAHVSETRADGCQAAVARFNAASRAEGQAFATAFQQVFGSLPDAFAAAHHGDSDPAAAVTQCRKVEPLLQARIPRIEAAIPLFNAAHGACAKVSKTRLGVRGLPDDLNTPEALITKVKTLIAGCEAVIAESGDAASPAPGNQAATPNSPANRGTLRDQAAGEAPQQERKDIACTGAITSNGCTTKPAAPPNKPTSVVIGNQPDKPVPRASQATQQTTVIRRSEESSIFQSSSSRSSSSSGGCTDDVGPGMLLVDPGISLIGSGDCSGSHSSNAPGARPNQRGAGSPNQNLSALYLLNKRYPNDAPPVTAQDLQCMLAGPQSGSDVQNLPPLRLCPGRGWDLGTMWTDGIDATGLCKGITDDDEYQHCAEENYGTAVITVMPEMSSYCYEGPDYNMDDVAKCAGRKFKKAWYDRIFNHIPPGDDCAVIPPPSPPTWTAAGDASCKPTRPSLRKRIKASLCKSNPDSCQPPGDDDDTTVPVQPPQQQQPQADEAPKPLPKELEAWCNFMADAHRRGDYGNIPIPPECPRESAASAKPAPALPLFSMNQSETDQVVNDLIKEWDDHWNDDSSKQPNQTDVPK